MAKSDLPNYLVTVSDFLFFFDKCLTKIYLFFLKELFFLDFFNKILCTYIERASINVSISIYKKSLLIGTSNIKNIVLHRNIIAISILETLIRTSSLGYKWR